MINWLKNRRALKREAKALYHKAEAQARSPVFYAEMGVPDTVDGRFEMISLHCYILMHRLQKAGNKKLAQKLFDAFFKHMDRSLRGLGIGDLGVPKHMKRMMQGFNGRANHYELAMINNSTEELLGAVRQNIYGTIDNVDKADLERVAEYIQDNVQVTGEDFVPPKVIKSVKRV